MSNDGRVIIAGFLEELEGAIENRHAYDVRFNLNGIMATSAAFDIGIPMRVYELMREAFDVLNTSKGSSIVLTTTRRDLSTVDALKFIVASCHDLADDDKRSELKERVTKMTGLTDRQYSRWIKTDVGEIITLYMLGLYDPFVLLDGALDTYVKNEGRNV